MQLKSFLTFCFAIALSITFASAQSTPVGVWKTIDDETGEAKSHVEIFQKDGKLHAKVVKLLQKPEDTVCEECSGDKKGKRIVGMEILWDLEPYDDYWSYGQILDPNNGKVYKCNVYLEEDNKLTVRGYVGFSLLGRSQEWFRVGQP